VWVCRRLLHGYTLCEWVVYLMCPVFGVACVLFGGVLLFCYFVVLGLVGGYTWCGCCVCFGVLVLDCALLLFRVLRVGCGVLVLRCCMCVV